MTPTLILLGALLLTGLILWTHHRLTGGDDADEQQAPTAAEERPDGCCGQHAVCEKLAEAALAEDDYYDDDELDAYAGRAADAYSDEETEQFREVLMTLQQGEVLAWTQALYRRGIAIPTALRDEVMMLA